MPEQHRLETPSHQETSLPEGFLSPHWDHRTSLPLVFETKWRELTACNYPVKIPSDYRSLIRPRIITYIKSSRNIPGFCSSVDDLDLMTLEIGFLSSLGDIKKSPCHFPRILDIKNGVAYSLSLSLLLSEGIVALRAYGGCVGRRVCKATPLVFHPKRQSTNLTNCRG